ncbi:MULTISPECIES: hypothetical protein [Streptococcus]|nr:MULTISPECIES: hypothetical protein [Streptococcus]MDU2934385.1 hypothetical protein [Streptococcus salivarius]
MGLCYKLFKDDDKK